jgi:putative endonuclease
MSADNFYIYIITNKNRTTLYIGMTNSLRRRLYEHQNEAKGFAKRYMCRHLVYFEVFPTPVDAILREKEIKKWRREKKVMLINGYNPTWEFKDHLFLQGRHRHFGRREKSVERELSA